MTVMQLPRESAIPWAHLPLIDPKTVDELLKKVRSHTLKRGWRLRGWIPDRGLVFERFGSKFISWTEGSTKHYVYACIVDPTLEREPETFVQGTKIYSHPSPTFEGERKAIVCKWIVLKDLDSGRIFYASSYSGSRITVVYDGVVHTKSVHTLFVSDVYVDSLTGGQNELD